MKRVLALVLTVVMLAGFMAFSASAEDWVSGPTLSLSATEPDADGAFTVALNFSAEKKYAMGAYTLNLVYDPALVAVDTTKGSYSETSYDADFNEITVKYGVDLPAGMLLRTPVITPCASLKVKGVDSTAFSISAASSSMVVSEASQDMVVYFNLTDAARAAGGIATFILASDSAENFAVTDNTGNNSLPLPAHESIKTTVAIPISAVTLTGTVTTPAKNATDATALEAENTVVTHSWSPALSGGKFAAETVYTLTITVKPAEGAAFAEDCTVTYPGYTFTRQADGSYTASKTFPATLGKDAATVTVGDIADQTYTGAQITPAVTVNTDPALTENTDYTVTYGENVNAGKGSVTVSPVASSEYTFEAVTKEFNILPVTVGLTWPAATALPYTGSEQSVEATVTGLLGSDSANLSYTGNTATDVGSYTAQVTAIDNANYALPADGSASQAWSITKADYRGAALSASAIVPAKGIADKSFALSELNLPASFQNAKITVATPDGSLATAAAVAANGKSITYTTAEAADNATGSVTLTISSKNWNNVTATLNLTARTLDTDPGFAEVSVADVEYGQTNAEAVSLPRTVTLTDPENNSVQAALSVKDADKVNNAGTATVTVVLTVTQEGAYKDITAEKNFDYTVSPKAVAVTWANTALTYTGAAQAPTASAEGVNGETLSLGVSGAQTDAGENYTATASIASVTGGNANPANYTLAADTATFSIAPKATTFTVTLDETTFTENGAEQKPAVTVQDGETKLTEGKDYTLSFAPAESILPGSYTVTATGAGNYAGSSGTAGYSIIGKPGYVSLSLSNGQTALTASYVFQDNGSDITGYTLNVYEVDGETVRFIGSFEAGTQTRYTVSDLSTGSTYRVVVTATNAVGSTDSEAQEITLSRRSNAPLYPVTVERTEHGSVSASYSYCKAGNTVKLTVNPDEGYELAELTVTDADGKAVEVAEDNSFVMPAAAVTVSAVFQAEGTEPLHFDDVAEDAWYHDAVYWAAGDGVAQGKDEHIFAPEDISSRGELITFLWRAAGKPESTIANPYTDVSESDECYQAVLWATEQGITVGTAEGEFSPHAAVTRAQMVVFIYRAEQAEPVDVENPFTDVEADAYYYDAVLWAVDKGVTVGTSATTFSPNMACTRAHAVTFLYRLYA